MKKSLSLCCLLAFGVAMADTEPLYHLTFDAAATSAGVDLTNTGTAADIVASSSGGYMNWKDDENYTSDSGCVYNNNSNYLSVNLNGQLTLQTDFTLTFACKLSAENPGTWRNLLSVHVGDDHIRVQNDTATSFGLYPSIEGTEADSATKGTLSTEEFTRVTLVYDYNSEAGAASSFTLYSDNTLVATWDSAFTGTEITGIHIGGNGSYNRTPLLIDEVGIYGVALTQQQIADNLVGKASGAIPAAVPEPATATLSLLALAGLAARRRRK